MKIDLVKEICLALDTAGNYFKKNPDAGYALWITWVHREVVKVAENFARSLGIAFGTPTDASFGAKRLVVCTTDGHLFSAAEGQFIFDQSWLTRYENGYTNRLNFVMEIEFDPDSGNINYDFAKIVMAKADLKVMVCAAYDCARCSVIINELSNQASAFERADESIETYLFSVYCSDDHKFHHFIKKGMNPAVSV
jgi:hypothetical protein